ncbi:nucleotidyltransferase family protein [Candidatus Daviesbacteria bacterium]|nr:nucleotidyltransferase family protein [Candidatus Daviesbacteria bacterium]
MNLDKIKDVIQKKMSILESKYDVKSLGVFGSVSRGEEKKESDVDILVEFTVTPGFFKFIELEEFLGGLIGKKVDLVTKKALKPVLKDEILREVSYV